MRIVIFASLIVAASLADARDVSQLELIRCANFDNATEKLNCFESLIQEMPTVSLEGPDQQKAEEKKGFMFGLGKLRKKDKKVNDDTTYHATVTKVEEGNFGVLYFYTEEGHVWRQIEDDQFWYPRKQSFNIEINRGWMGSYKLKVDGKGRFTTVRRLK
ncbi:MAG: hypothetical protein JKY88_13440 [Pseudomonadales bacterium]|nr:hypothetical protein [Pseudomonadales bacterium]